LSTDLANATRTGFSGTTLDNPKNETCKMMEVEKDEEKEVHPLISEHKLLEAYKLLAKELKTLRDVIQTRRVTINQCCNNLLEYLFSPTGKLLFNKMVAVTKENSKDGDNFPKEKKDVGCFSVPVTIKGFYVGEVMCDLGSSANMMSLSLFNTIGGMELKPCEVRIGLADGSLKNEEGVIETVDIVIDGFIFPIEVVVMEMKVLNRAQMILGRPFLATARAIINLDQGKIIIRLGEDYITYKVYGQYHFLKRDGVPKEEPIWISRKRKKSRSLKDRGSQAQVRDIRQA
jgi:hypothetical protein